MLSFRAVLFSANRFIFSRVFRDARTGVREDLFANESHRRRLALALMKTHSATRRRPPGREPPASYPASDRAAGWRPGLKLSITCNAWCSMARATAASPSSIWNLQRRRVSILATIAKQERIRISERVHAGLAKARKQCRIGGRPRLVLDRAKIAQLDSDGYTIREIAAEMGCSSASIHRVLKSHHLQPGHLIPM